ncbi:MAG: hypothetical protein QW484_00815 [Candidatus Pacearchaeota archaeon]
MEKNIFGIFSIISGALSILLWVSVRPLLEIFYIGKKIAPSASVGLLYTFPIIAALVFAILGTLLAIIGLLKLKKYKIFNWMVYLGIILNTILIVLILTYPRCC